MLTIWNKIKKINKWPVLIEYKTITNVISSTVEARIGGLFHNAQISIPLRVMLEELGHIHPVTPIKPTIQRHMILYTTVYI